MKQVILVIRGGLTPNIVYPGSIDYRVHSLVFVDLTEEEAKHEIYEWAWQDRAEWVGQVPFRTYQGWKLKDVIEYEGMLCPGIDVRY